MAHAKKPMTNNITRMRSPKPSKVLKSPRSPVLGERATTDLSQARAAAPCAADAARAVLLEGSSANFCDAPAAARLRPYAVSLSRRAIPALSIARSVAVATAAVTRRSSIDDQESSAFRASLCARVASLAACSDPAQPTTTKHAAVAPKALLTVFQRSLPETSSCGFDFDRELLGISGLTGPLQVSGTAASQNSLRYVRRRSPGLGCQTTTQSPRSARPSCRHQSSG